MRDDDRLLIALIPEEQPPEEWHQLGVRVLRGIRKMEFQLGAKVRTNADGVKLSAAEYEEWRKNCKKAMIQWVEIYRRYKFLEKHNAIRQKANYRTAPAATSAAAEQSDR